MFFIEVGLAKGDPSTSCLTAELSSTSASCLDLSRPEASGSVKLFLSLSTISDSVDQLMLEGMSKEDPEFIAAERIFSIVRSQSEKNVILYMHPKDINPYDCAIYQQNPPHSEIDIFIDETSASAQGKTCQNIKNSIYSVMTFNNAVSGITNLYKHAGLSYLPNTEAADAYKLYSAFGIDKFKEKAIGIQKGKYRAAPAYNQDVTGASIAAYKNGDTRMTIFLPRDSSSTVKGTISSKYAPLELSHHNSNSEIFIISKSNSRNNSEWNNPLSLRKSSIDEFTLKDGERTIKIQENPFQIDEVSTFFKYAKQFELDYNDIPPNARVFFDSISK